MRPRGYDSAYEGGSSRKRTMVAPGMRAMAAGAFFFSVMSLLVKVAGQRLPPQEIVLGRAVVSLTISWVALRRAGVSPWGQQRRGLLWLRGVVGFAALSCFYYALVHLPLADATIIQYTNPLMAAVLAGLLLRESLVRRELLLALVALVGVVLVAKPSFLFGGGKALDPTAVLVGTGGAALSGLAYVLVRRLGASEHGLVIVFHFALVGALGSALFVIPSWVAPSLRDVLVLLGVGVATQLGQVSITRGLRLEPAGRATAMGYLQIVFAMLFGLVIFGEVPGPWTLLGAALVTGAALLLATVTRPRS